MKFKLWVVGMRYVKKAMGLGMIVGDSPYLIVLSSVSVSISISSSWRHVLYWNNWKSLQKMYNFNVYILF